MVSGTLSQKEEATAPSHDNSGVALLKRVRHLP